MEPSRCPQVVFFLKLKLEHLEYYILRLWISFKSCILAGLCWRSFDGGKGNMAFSCQVGMEIQVPLLASVDTRGRERLLVTAGQWWVGIRLPTWVPLTPWGGGLGGESHDCWVVVQVPSLHCTWSDPPTAPWQRKGGVPCYHLVEEEV